MSEERFDDETSRRLFTMTWDALVAYLGCHPRKAHDKYVNYEGSRVQVSMVWAVEHEQLKIRRHMEAHREPGSLGGAREGAGRPTRHEVASKVVKSVRLTEEEIQRFEAEMLPGESWSAFLRRRLEGDSPYLEFDAEDLDIISRNARPGESSTDYLRRLLRRDELGQDLLRKRRG